MNDGNLIPASDSPYNNELGHPTQAARFDQGKVRLELLPSIFTYCVARVFTFGAQKYDDWNWAKGFPWLQPYASLMRHLVAWHRGEDLDPESGLPHLDHAACNLAMLITFREEGLGEDNRHKFAPVETCRTPAEYFVETFLATGDGGTWVRQQSCGRPAEAALAVAEDLRNGCYASNPVRVVGVQLVSLSDGSEREAETTLAVAFPGDPPMIEMGDGDCGRTVEDCAAGFDDDNFKGLGYED